MAATTELGTRSEAFAALFSRAKGGDAEAVAALYDRYGPAVLGTVRRRLSSELRRRYDTMDLAHSVFAEVIRSLPRIEDRGEGAFVRLLTIKAENKIRTKLRRHVGKGGARLERRLATDFDLEGPGADAGRAAAQFDDEAKLRRLLGELDEPAREILRRRGDGESFETIATALGLPGAEATRKRYARTVIRLRTRWDDDSAR